MWTATIENKELKNGVLKIAVLYSNGVQTASETIDMTGGTVDTLDTKIQSKLNTLNVSDVTLAETVIGEFAPQTKQATAFQDFLVKWRTLQNVKRVVDAGIIDKSNPLFTSALAEATAAFDPSYVGQF